MIHKLRDFWWRNETFMTGHISIRNLTVYGRNAMHWGVNFYTKKIWIHLLSFAIPVLREVVAIVLLLQSQCYTVGGYIHAGNEERL